VEKNIHPTRIISEEGSEHFGSKPTLKYTILNSGDPEIVADLIKNGADVNWVRPTVGETVGDLFYLSEKRNIALLKVLINAGLDLNAKGRSGNTLLYNLSKCNDTEFIKLVLDSGADVNLGDVHGNTPISCVSARGDSETLQLLIDYGGEINTINDLNVTPLYEAILGDQKPIVLEFGNKEPKLENIKILINAGADVNAVCNNQSILDLAYEIEDEEVIKILKDAGATKRVQK